MAVVRWVPAVPHLPWLTVPSTRNVTVIRLRTAAVLTVAALLVACAAAPAPDTSSVAAVPDISVIVLDADSAPEGTALNATGQTVAAVIDRVVVSGRETQFMELPGLGAARYNEFSGDGGLFMSLGLQFDTPQNADSAFDLFLDEFESEEGYGFADSLTSDTVGDEGVCAEGENRDVGNVNERICLWRTGEMILVVGGTQTWPDTLALAETMDSRAR
jgi:hypothetical protein